MTAQIIDGRKIAVALREQIAGELCVAVLEGLRPGLATLVVGDDPAAASYLRRIDRTAAQLGVARRKVVLPGTGERSRSRRWLPGPGR